MPTLREEEKNRDKIWELLLLCSAWVLIDSIRYLSAGATLLSLKNRDGKRKTLFTVGQDKNL